MSDSRSDMIARVNSVRISTADLMRVSDKVARLSPELRDGEGLVHVTAQLFKPDVYKAFAVAERLYALVALLTSGAIPQSLVPEAADGGLMVSDELFSVAAQEPLLFRDNRSYFQPESFLSSLLNLAKPNGRA